MEIHRLNETVPHDRDTFNRLYKKIKTLKNSLVYQVDARRFGVTSDIIASYFDDKFLFVFNKYYQKVSEDVLLGHLINSLKTFKLRLLRVGYQPKYEELYNNSIRLDDLPNLFNKGEDENRELFLDLLFSFIERNISEEAYELFLLDLYPPLYIKKRLKPNQTKIPNSILSEFLGLPLTQENLSKLRSWRTEIEKVLVLAKAHFNTLPNPVY